MTRHRPLKPHACRRRRRYVLEFSVAHNLDRDVLDRYREDVERWLDGRDRVLGLVGAKLKELR